MNLDKLERISRLVSPPLEEELRALAKAVLLPDDKELPAFESIEGEITWLSESDRKRGWR